MLDSFSFLIFIPFILGYFVYRVSDNGPAGVLVCVSVFIIILMVWLYIHRIEVDNQNMESRKREKKRLSKLRGNKVLKGKVGFAATDLKLYGECVVEGERYQSKSVNGLITKGSNIEVVGIESETIAVKTVN